MVCNSISSSLNETRLPGLAIASTISSSDHSFESLSEEDPDSNDVTAVLQIITFNSIDKSPVPDSPSSILDLPTPHLTQQKIVPDCYNNAECHGGFQVMTLDL